METGHNPIQENDPRKQPRGFDMEAYLANPEKAQREYSERYQRGLAAATRVLGCETETVKVGPSTTPKCGLKIIATNSCRNTY